uniref:Uncharacterized protein n=1 Tax=Acrobeloides nanus TaxID=290746 RepID=A0A914C2I0_9BILA
MLCLGLPYLFMIGTIILGLTNVIQIIEWIFEFSTLHSCFNTLVMIASISSYRKALWDMFRLKTYNQVNKIPNAVIMLTPAQRN